MDYGNWQLYPFILRPSASGIKFFIESEQIWQGNLMQLLLGDSSIN